MAKTLFEKLKVPETIPTYSPALVYLLWSYEYLKKLACPLANGAPAEKDHNR